MTTGTRHGHRPSGRRMPSRPGAPVAARAPRCSRTIRPCSALGGFTDGVHPGTGYPGNERRDHARVSWQGIDGDSMESSCADLIGPRPPRGRHCARGSRARRCSLGRFSTSGSCSRRPPPCHPPPCQAWRSTTRSRRHSASGSLLQSKCSCARPAFSSIIITRIRTRASN